MRKDMKKLVKEAKKQGFEVRISKTNHPMFYKNGAFVAKGASTPSDSRGFANLIAQLRRAGLKWPPKR